MSELFMRSRFKLFDNIKLHQCVGVQLNFDLTYSQHILIFNVTMQLTVKKKQHSVCTRHLVADGNAHVCIFKTHSIFQYTIMP